MEIPNLDEKTSDVISSVVDVSNSNISTDKATTEVILIDEAIQEPTEISRRETIESILAQNNEDNLESYEERKRSLRDSDKVTDDMIDDIIELLNVFGLPYMTAPSEAEAQCAALEQLGLVDGVVTEDSDTFLFGGINVYKNMFEDKKIVEVNMHVLYQKIKDVFYC